MVVLLRLLLLYCPLPLRTTTFKVRQQSLPRTRFLRDGTRSTGTLVEKVTSFASVLLGPTRTGRVSR